MNVTVPSRNSVPIRLTAERWVHITEEHAELAGMRLEVVGNGDPCGENFCRDGRGVAGGARVRTWQPEF